MLLVFWRAPVFFVDLDVAGFNGRMIDDWLIENVDPMVG